MLKLKVDRDIIEIPGAPQTLYTQQMINDNQADEVIPLPLIQCNQSQR